MADYLSVVYNEASHPYTDYPPKLCAYLFQAFQMKPGMKMLEPGCGRGEFLKNFQKLGLACTGLDCSAETQLLTSAFLSPVPPAAAVKKCHGVVAIGNFVCGI